MITLINDNHVDLKEILAFVNYGSNANNRLKKIKVFVLRIDSTITKYAYSNILKFFPPKNEKLSDEKFW